MGPGEWVYLDGQFKPVSEAMVSPFDRGFLFAHAAYEVTGVFDSRLIDFQGHVARLQRTLEGTDIPFVWTASELEDIHLDLAARNGTTEGLIYLQVTAGAYGGRDFAGPEALQPSIFMFSEQRSLIGEKARDGVASMLIEDQRWKRRDYKTTQLLSQALAYREAARKGLFSAILHEDGYVTEAASSNLWVVTADGTLVTRDLGHHILAGITRETVMARLVADGGTIEERAVGVSELKYAREVFTSSATGLVLPIVEIDGEKVGSGTPGPVTRKAQRLYYEGIGADIATRAPWLKAPD